MEKKQILQQALMQLNAFVCKQRRPDASENVFFLSEHASETGDATPEEAADYYVYWNDRAVFVLEKADTLNGFFTVTVYE